MNPAPTTATSHVTSRANATVHGEPAHARADCHDDFFVAEEIPAEALSAAHLADLAGGTVAALRVGGFLPEALRRDALSRLTDDHFPMEGYDRDRVDPPIARFGPVLNDFNEGGVLREAYWDRAAWARETWRRSMGTVDPLETSVTRLAEAWGRPIGPATIGGRPVFAGALREINEGALIHFDDVRREYGPSLFDGGVIVAQLAFNAWISVGAGGGSTRIWRHRWHPADARLRQGYGYRLEVVKGQQTLVLSFQPGDALIFDPRNFHAVDPCEKGRRIAITFFLGLTVAGELMIWS